MEWGEPKDIGPPPNAHYETVRSNRFRRGMMRGLAPLLSRDGRNTRLSQTFLNVMQRSSTIHLH